MNISLKYYKFLYFNDFLNLNINNKQINFIKIYYFY